MGGSGTYVDVGQPEWTLVEKWAGQFVDALLVGPWIVQ